MISTNEFKTNVTVTIDGDAWQVVEFQHVKPVRVQLLSALKCVICVLVLLLNVPLMQANVCRKHVLTVVKCNIYMNLTDNMFLWITKTMSRPN